MQAFIILFIILICWKIVKPPLRLYNFNSEATIPLRGILALFIMFHHISHSYDLTFGISFLDKEKFLTLNVFYDMGAPIVGIFFFLTGYGLAKSFSFKGKEYIAGFLRKRLINTLPEFVFLTILISLYFVIIGVYSFPQIISNFGEGFPPLPNSWFMYAITYIYTSFYISALISKGNIIISSYIFTILTFTYILITYKLDWGGWWYLSTLAVPLGYFTAIYERFLNGLIKNKLFLFSFVCIFCILYYIAHYRLHLASSTLLIYGIIVMCYITMRLYSLPNWKILVTLGDISLYIYLIHGVWIMYLQKYEIQSAIALCLIVILSILSAYGMKLLRLKINSYLK